LVTNDNIATGETLPRYLALPEVSSRYESGFGFILAGILQRGCMYLQRLLAGYERRLFEESGIVNEKVRARCKSSVMGGCGAGRLTDARDWCCIGAPMFSQRTVVNDTE
jgi:hypothetical protein